MISKNQIKFITSLKQKKFRQQHQCFVVEGVKGVEEFLNSDFELHSLFATKKMELAEYELITQKDLKRISFLNSPNVALAVFKIPKSLPVDHDALILALDAVRDPGNLGTIIRLCDWFGIKDLVCSKATVDCFNPKVVQATMGSLTRVNVSYTDLEVFLEGCKTPILGAFMDGDNVYSLDLPKKGVLVMGNEANGVSFEVEKLISSRVSIPRFGDLKATESLNVATATAILLSEFKKNPTL